MFVFQLNINMPVIVLNIESFFWNNPTISCKIKQILMEVSNSVGIGLVDLTKALVVDSLLYSLAIYF